MKNKENEKYFKWGLTALIVTALAILFANRVFNGNGQPDALNLLLKILRPFVFGGVIAYLVTPLANWLFRLFGGRAKGLANVLALVIAALAAMSDAALLWRHPHPGGQMLWCVILIGVACLAALAAFFAIGRRPEFGVLGTSLAGAVAHNIGQILAASSVLHTPQLLYTYLPVLVGIGAAVGCLTGLVVRRVFKALGHGTRPDQN